MFLDIWPIPLRGETISCVEIEANLSSEERQRAARFRFAEHALRYRICHAGMRRILGSYLALPPSHVDLIAQPKGKPRLAGDSRLRFNLSHSGDLALLAVAEDFEVGVDVEEVRFDLSVDGLAGFFTAAERERLRAEAPGDKERTFFRWWTRKEAVLKADGCGLSGGLDRLDISGCPPELVRFPAESGAWWRVHDLDVAPGYAAAVAAPPGDWQIRVRAIGDDELVG